MVAYHCNLYVGNYSDIFSFLSVQNDVFPVSFVSNYAIQHSHHISNIIYGSLKQFSKLAFTNFFLTLGTQRESVSVCMCAHTYIFWNI